MSIPDDYDEDDYYWSASCESVGMGGDCGPECPVYLRGECDIEDEIDEVAIECAMKKEIDDDILTDVVYEAVQDKRINGSFDDAMEIFEKD